MSYSWGGWEDEFKGLTKETNFAGSANKSLGAKPDNTSGGNNNDDDGDQGTAASSIFKNIAKSVVDNTDVSVDEAIDILTPEHNTDVRPSKLNTSRKHNTYFKNLEENRATQFEFLQGFIDSDINETVFKPQGKNYSSSSVGVFTEITERRHPGQNISLRDTSSGKKVTSGGLMEAIKQNMSYDMLNKPFDYSSATRYTPAIPTMTTIPPTALKKGFSTFRDSLTFKEQLDPSGEPKIDLSETLKKTFRTLRDKTIETQVSDAATGSTSSSDRTMRFTSDFDYNREEPGLSTAALGFETDMGGAELSASKGITNVDEYMGLNVGGKSYAGYQYGLTSDLYNYGDTAQYTLTTPTVDGLTGTTSFGAEGTSVGLTKAGDAFLGGKYNFSINADDDNNVNAELIAGWEW
jgi:hypothetical protein